MVVTGHTANVGRADPVDVHAGAQRSPDVAHAKLRPRWQSGPLGLSSTWSRMVGYVGLNSTEILDAQPASLDVRAALPLIDPR